MPSSSAERTPQIWNRVKQYRAVLSGVVRFRIADSTTDRALRHAQFLQERMNALTCTPLLSYNFHMSSILNSLSAAQLTRAVAIKEQIEKLETELSGIAGEFPKAAPSARPFEAPGKRVMSAAARAKISAAQKARWAKERGESTPEKGDKAAAKPKRHISAAGRARIIAATKARWARYNAAKKAQ